MNINYELLLQQRKKLEDDVHEQVEQDSRTLFCNFTSSDRRLVKVSQSVCSPLWALQSGLRPAGHPEALRLGWLVGRVTGLAGWVLGLAGWHRGRRTYVWTNGRKENLL